VPSPYKVAEALIKPPEVPYWNEPDPPLVRITILAAPQGPVHVKTTDPDSMP
jgi:hypothetical protein